MKKLNYILLSIILCLRLSLYAQSDHPAVIIPFILKEAGYVTLVVEDETGHRVRNLIADTWFKAGKNTASWDGMDDLGRDVQAAAHGVYSVPSKLVAAGKYTIRGIVHTKVNTNYEFSVYNSGNPPWSTADHTGGWLANHTPPQAAVFVPAEQSPNKQPLVFLGSYVSEGPDGFAWVDLDGKKLGGKKWLGGIWTAAPYMAIDKGEKTLPGISVYIASVWETAKKSGQLELRISTYPSKADKPLLLSPIGTPAKEGDMQEEIGGLAVWNGIAVVSLTKQNKLLFIDLKEKKVMSSFAVDAPKGIAFDIKGQLLILSENRLLKLSNSSDLNHLPAAQPLIASKLVAPVGITQDAKGNIYISDGGNSHQVKVFSEDGKYISTIGKPGTPSTGAYDPLHMNNPAGMAIDSRSQLWVTEKDYLPKRVSVWSLDGKLLKSFYGPGKYGGGGTLDAEDKNNFYYANEEKGTLGFKLDWQTGKFTLDQILYRQSTAVLPLARGAAAPETPLFYKGKRYFTNAYNSDPTGGQVTSFLFTERNGTLYPCAAMGRAESWDVLKDPQFRSLLPAGTNLSVYNQQTQVFFIWTDLNEDAKVQAQELSFKKGAVGGVTVMPDLSFCISQVDGKAMQFSPESFTARGTPVYNMDSGKILASGVQLSGSSGGNQLLADSNGWTVLTQGIAPYHRYSISGSKDGKPLWSYPNLWPGLHASHQAPPPSFPGELIGPTRLLGGLIKTGQTDPISLWAVNSNHGMVYIFTSDGLFVTTLFQPIRSGQFWKMPAANRGMDLGDVTLGEENFWPTITQTADGKVYLVDGSRMGLIKVDGLQTLARISPVTVTVDNDALQRSIALQVKAESARQQAAGNGVLQIPVTNTAMTVDGKWDDWQGADWVSIDNRGVKANFNSKSKPYDVTGSLAVSGDKLYIGYQTGDPALLKNSGETPLAPFKTGGALDLMIGSGGNMRLLITRINEKTKALLYKATVAGTKTAERVPFSSPWRTVTFDKVEDVSAKILLAASSDGSYEVAVPLSLLDLKPAPGLSIKGDIGILRGDGSQTMSRVYWNNKATALVSDVPSEAELTPNLWGTWKFK